MAELLCYYKYHDPTIHPPHPFSLTGSPYYARKNVF